MLEPESRLQSITIMTTDRQPGSGPNHDAHGRRAILPPAPGGHGPDHFSQSDLDALVIYRPQIRGGYLHRIHTVEAITQPTGRFREQMTGIYNPAGWGAYLQRHAVRGAVVIAGAS